MNEKCRQCYSLNTPYNSLNVIGTVMIRDVVGNSLVFYRARRSTINYFYILCGSTSREDSSDGELVSKICRSPIT